jgi:hypothetical protein
MRAIPAQGRSLRARSHGLAELPSPGHDPQIAHIFRNMRAAMRQPREAVARRLATTVAVIDDLENGAVGALPHWPETVRIVRSYCELLGLDSQPLLWRIQQILRGGTRVGDDLPTRPVGAPPMALRKPAREPPSPRHGSGLGGLLLLALPPVVMAGVATLAIWAPAPTYKLISRLPHSLEVPARVGMDLIVLYSAPRDENGFRWIDVGDPRVRKVDKLVAKAR